MSRPEPTERARRLLDLVVGSVPGGVPPEQHQEDVVSILEFFERLHIEQAAVFPGWLVLGGQLYLTHLRPGEEPT